MTVKHTLVSLDMRVFALCSLMELHRNKQAYSLLYKEFPMFMTPAILQNIRPLTLQQIIQMVRPYISRPKLNMLLEQLENI